MISCFLLIWAELRIDPASVSAALHRFLPPGSASLTADPASPHLAPSSCAWSAPRRHHFSSPWLRRCSPPPTWPAYIFSAGRPSSCTCAWAAAFISPRWLCQVPTFNTLSSQFFSLFFVFFPLTHVNRLITGGKPFYHLSKIWPRWHSELFLLSDKLSVWCYFAAENKHLRKNGNNTLLCFSRAKLNASWWHQQYLSCPVFDKAHGVSHPDS